MRNFQGASSISMQTAVFNEIGGNQITNHYAVQQRERTIYDEFKYILLGDVEMIQELGEIETQYGLGWNKEAPVRVVKMVSSALVHCGQGSKCMVLSYSGPAAEEASLGKGFSVNYSAKKSTDHATVWNQSVKSSSINIPQWMLLELVPLSHVWHDLHHLGRSYFVSLAQPGSKHKFRCDEDELWIDPKQGALIHGLRGPHCKHVLHLLMETLPMLSSLDLLQDDVLWTYLSGIKPLDREFDGNVVVLLARQFSSGGKPISSLKSQPIVHSALTGFTIAVGGMVWWGLGSSCLDCRVQMPDGAVRWV
ncbi:hypothetical protein E1B28_003710 [Marasmius oreades]|uniref:Uncharacterized protein n=1 Tax=Marasmius oreades TaxID=181124 RepID=A0A9P7UX51_9AGAR|nr:uncharacterized protein E1B28_003710 [Marasmius oreades]KAG7096262.1 hypothetical protein E1B28_003710 [Marasmius oreades]